MNGGDRMTLEDIIEYEKYPEPGERPLLAEIRRLRDILKNDGDVMRLEARRIRDEEK